MAYIGPPAALSQQEWEAAGERDLAFEAWLRRQRRLTVAVSVAFWCFGMLGLAALAWRYSGGG